MRNPNALYSGAEKYPRNFSLIVGTEPSDGDSNKQNFFISASYQFL